MSDIFWEEQGRSNQEYGKCVSTSNQEWTRENFSAWTSGTGTWIKDENDRISEGGVDEDQVTVGVPLIVQDLENFARIHGAII